MTHSEKSKEYDETRPATVSSGVRCRQCKQEVEWITFLGDGSNVGVCGCRWTTWMKTEAGKVIRSSSGV